jgi:hypothetical protein
MIEDAPVGAGRAHACPLSYPAHAPVAVAIRPPSACGDGALPMGLATANQRAQHDRETPPFRAGSGSFARVAVAFRPPSAQHRALDTLCTPVPPLPHNPGAGNAGRTPISPAIAWQGIVRGTAADDRRYGKRGCPGIDPPGPTMRCRAEGGLKAGARPANDPLPGLKAGVSRSRAPGTCTWGAGRTWGVAEGGLKAGATRATGVLPALKGGVSRIGVTGIRRALPRTRDRSMPDRIGCSRLDALGCRGNHPRA